MTTTTIKSWNLSKRISMRWKRVHCSFIQSSSAEFSSTIYETAHKRREVLEIFFVYCTRICSKILKCRRDNWNLKFKRQYENFWGHKKQHKTTLREWGNQWNQMFWSWIMDSSYRLSSFRIFLTAHIHCVRDKRDYERWKNSLKVVEFNMLFKAEIKARGRKTIIRVRLAYKHKMI